MIVKYNDKIYNIEELSYKSEYFEILKSSNFNENIDKILDILTNTNFLFYLYKLIYVEELIDFDVLLLLDEFCVKYSYQKYYYDKIILDVVKV